MKPKILFCASSMLILLVACGNEPADLPPPAEETDADTVPSVESAPAPADILATEGVNSGRYELETTHASLVWTVSHNGLSKYTARFTDFDVALDLDAADPAASNVTAAINPVSIRTDHPSGPDWDTTLGSDEKWFNAGAFPEISYKSTGIDLTSDNTGTISGELTLLGITKSVPLNVTYNGTRNFPWYGERDVVGFSATASLRRSDFGMLYLLPDIGDDVTIQIEAEFVEAEPTG